MDARRACGVLVSCRYSDKGIDDILTFGFSASGAGCGRFLGDDDAMSDEEDGASLVMVSFCKSTRSFFIPCPEIRLCLMICRSVVVTLFPQVSRSDRDGKKQKRARDERREGPHDGR